MAYSVQADLVKTIPLLRLKELTDDVNGTTVDTAVITEQIKFADAFINLHLRAKHIVPLTSVPDEVRLWSVIIAIKYLYDRRVDLQIPDTLQKRFETAEKMLVMVQEGTLAIDDAGSVRATASFIKTNKTADSRIFTANDEQNGVLDGYFSQARITPC